MNAHHHHQPPARQERVTVWALWLPGLLVAVGAGAATAHGLYEVAAAARVPVPIAWLYPLITDGLALVAYASTARLTEGGRRYAWTVVVLAAGLSGLAQASYLAGGVETAPPTLRFGIGAWPAVAAAIVAHLLYLLAAHSRGTDERPVPVSSAPVQPGVQAPRPAASGDKAERPGAGVQSAVETTRPITSPASLPASERARIAAQRHESQHGRFPTARHLADLAEVSRGTAGSVLKELRDQRHGLHIVTDTSTSTTGINTTGTDS